MSPVSAFGSIVMPPAGLRQVSDGSPTGLRRPHFRNGGNNASGGTRREPIRWAIALPTRVAGVCLVVS